MCHEDLLLSLIDLYCITNMLKSLVNAIYSIEVIVLVENIFLEMKYSRIPEFQPLEMRPYHPLIRTL